MPANKGILSMKLLLTFRDICSGFCTGGVHIDSSRAWPRGRVPSEGVFNCLLEGHSPTHCPRLLEAFRAQPRTHVGRGPVVERTVRLVVVVNRSPGLLQQPLRRAQQPRRVLRV